MIKRYIDPKIADCGYCYTVQETCEYCGKQWVYDAYNFGNVYRDTLPCSCDSSRELKPRTHPFSLPSTWRYYPDTVIKNGERCQKCGGAIGRIKNDIINVCLSCGNREYVKTKQKPVMSPAIYRLPCSMTGLDAEVDNCNPPAIVVVVEPGDPLSAGCVDRYLTTDGRLIDCSIDSVDFAQWFELEELEEFEGDE